MAGTTTLDEYVMVVQGAVGPETGDVYVAGVGPGVTPGGQAVMMAGLVGTCGAQMPIKYDAAALVSSSDSDQALRQPMTLLMSSSLPQKQL